MPIVEPEILLDGDHPIERTLEVAENVWAEVFYYLAENNVVFEGILLKPSMVTPGAEHKEKASPETIAKFTLKLLNRRVPPAVPGIMVFPKTTFFFIVFFLILFIASATFLVLRHQKCLKNNITKQHHSLVGTYLTKRAHQTNMF